MARYRDFAAHAGLGLPPVGAAKEAGKKANNGKIRLILRDIGEFFHIDASLALPGSCVRCFLGE